MSNSVAEEWDQVPADPDPGDHLGYETRPLTVIHVEEGTESYLFLPGEDEHLHDDEFIIASPESVCNPFAHR